ncbi:MAG: MBL fold metallo-hydrolase [Ignavibacteriales bacterium]|nr:MBL fold metallo-hydrolase [Ignavibacteriales bacterium]
MKFKTWKTFAMSLVLIVFIVTVLSSCFTTRTVTTSSFVPSFRDREYSIISIGHATALIHCDSVNVLTDPNFNDWATIIHRSREAGLKLENLPPIDAIVISHAHRDHLDEWTLKQFPKDILVLISKGNGKYPRSWGFKNVREVDAWDSVVIRGVTIVATPAQHSGSRNLPSADEPKALGYIVKGEKTIYFAGDTGLFDGFKEIGDRAAIDVALLPIGAYRPRWYMKDHHMSPEDAVKAMAMLKARNMIPIHWGSFRMALDGLDEPKNVLLELVKNDSLRERVRVLENGEKYLMK